MEFQTRFPDNENQSVGLSMGFEAFVEKFRGVIQKKKKKTFEEVTLWDEFQELPMLSGKLIIK
jgi:hypothetical protein